MNGIPQLPDGFTPIANELLEALCRTRLPGEVRQVYDAVLRKTYGFHKKEDVLSYSQIEELTGLPRRSIKRAIKRLRDMNMIVVSNLTPGKPLSIGINKLYNTWVLVSNLTPVSKNVEGGVKSAPGVVSNLRPTKDTLKDTIQKKERNNLVQTLFARFWAAYPKKKNKGQAEKTWNKIKPDEALLEIILSAIAKQKRWEQWVKDRGKYIPHPSTWLNGKMWLDEEPAYQQSMKAGESLSQLLIARSNSGRR